MNDWAMDSSALRYAHHTGVLEQLCLPDRVRLSRLTWRPSPDAAFGPAMKPEFRYPVAHDLDAADEECAALCDTLESLHAAGAVIVDGEADGAEPHRVAQVEQAWRPAGLFGPLGHESLAAVLTADAAELPLVCADVDVRLLACYCGITTVTVAQFAFALAA